MAVADRIAPVSVWLAGVVFGPAVGVVLRLAWSAGGWQPFAFAVAPVLSVCGVCLLLGGRPAFVGWLLAAVLAGSQLTVGVMLVFAVAIRIGLGTAPLSEEWAGATLAASGGAACWLLTWPDVRAWCGLTPEELED